MNPTSLKSLHEATDDEMKSLVEHDKLFRDALFNYARESESHYFIDDILHQFIGVDIDYDIGAIYSSWVKFDKHPMNIHPVMKALELVQKNFCFFDEKGEALILRFVQAVAKADACAVWEEASGSYLYPDDKSIDEATNFYSDISDLFHDIFTDTFVSLQDNNNLMNYVDCFLDNYGDRLYYNPTERKVYEFAPINPDDFR